MSAEAIAEARRQIEICNACRYCEGFCSVFPAITRQRAFADGDITQLANLCHNCRGCHYACQYSPPHEFALNLPAALGAVRVESWERFARPAGFAGLFQRSGVAVAAALVAALAALLWAIQGLRPEGGEGFYAVLSHGAMIAIFGPAFLFPVVALTIGLREFWREVGGGTVTGRDLSRAFADAGRLKDLSGGQGQGCNYEIGDRFSNARRRWHQAVVWGFLMCFAATVSGTVMHYLLAWPAPYGPLSLPKLLGVPGGLLLTAGGAGLAWLKIKAEPELGAPGAWDGEMAFVLLLTATGASGLTLYAATGTGAVPALLAVHLSTVLTLFLLTPYSKMAHGFYRLAALARDAQQTENKE